MPGGMAKRVKKKFFFKRKTLHKDENGYEKDYNNS